MAEHDLFPCGERDESRFSPDFEVPLTSLEVQVAGDPSMPGDISCVQVLNGRKRRLDGSERTVISDLLELVKSHDPDLILCPHADTWIPIIVRKARTVRPGAYHQSHWLVQADGLQVVLELWKGQPQGWSHDSRGQGADRHC